MRPLLAILAFGCALTAQAQISYQNFDELTDFSQRDWVGGASPTYVPDGGPNGAGDVYLRISSTGTGGPGGRLASYSDGQRWTGNWLGLGVRYIHAHMRNESNLPLDIRFVAFRTSGQRWTSRTPLRLPPQQPWVRLTFPIYESAMVRVLGSQTYQQVLSDVTQIMFRHDAAPAGSGGDVIAAQMGWDKVRISKFPLPFLNTAVAN